MGVAIGVTRLDHSPAELRSLARNEAGAVACRILAIAHVLDGASRADAAASCGMDHVIAFVGYMLKQAAELIKGA
jgi:hypothetical protein